METSDGQKILSAVIYSINNIYLRRWGVEARIGATVKPAS